MSNILFITSESNIIQLITALLAIAFSFLTVIEKYKSIVTKSRETDNERSPKKIVRTTIISENLESRKKVNLVIGLLIASIFSFIIINSLIGSTQFISVDRSTIVSVFLIVIIISFLTFLSWLFGVEDKTIFAFSLGTLIILAFSSSGLLASNDVYIAYNSIGTFVTLFVVLFILSSYYFYLIRNQQGFAKIPNRTKFIIGIVIPVSLAGLTQSHIYLSNLDKDPKNPKKLIGDSKRLVDEINDRKLSFSTAYQLLSEIELMKYYNQQNDLVRNKYLPYQQINIDEIDEYYERRRNLYGAQKERNEFLIQKFEQFRDLTNKEKFLYERMTWINLVPESLIDVKKNGQNTRVGPC